jgi:hypothetical protein
MSRQPEYPNCRYSRCAPNNDFPRQGSSPAWAETLLQRGSVAQAIEPGWTLPRPGRQRGPDTLPLPALAALHAKT